MVRFTTQVVRDCAPDEDTFAAMSARFSAGEIVQLLLVVGQYMMVGRVMATAQLKACFGVDDFRTIVAMSDRGEIQIEITGVRTARVRLDTLAATRPEVFAKIRRDGKQGYGCAARASLRLVEGTVIARRLLTYRPVPRFDRLRGSAQSSPARSIFLAGCAVRLRPESGAGPRRRAVVR